MTGDLVGALRMLREACGQRVRAEVPLAPLTTFRIGGPAALYLEPDGDADLRAAAEAVRAYGIEFEIIGKGSNLLVADEGFAGLVLRLGKGYRWVAREGEHLRAGAAMALPAIAGVALQHGLAGLAFGVAIPASLGGAVRMNAGAHGGEMRDVIDSVEVFRLRGQGYQEIDGKDAGFAYRRSAFPEDAVIVRAGLALHAADPATIRTAMNQARSWRRETQPLAEPNCGSVFANPPGDHAARLIDESGLKGLQVGGASVSEKHANFIIAGPGATAADVRALIDTVRSRVAAVTGVELVPEVRAVGDVHG